MALTLDKNNICINVKEGWSFDYPSFYVFSLINNTIISSYEKYYKDISTIDSFYADIMRWRWR